VVELEEIRKYLQKVGLPRGDIYELPTSEKRFPDGAHFRIEVPTVNSYIAMESLLEKAKDTEITINRIDETFGIMRHTDEELEKMIKLAKS